MNQALINALRLQHIIDSLFDGLLTLWQLDDL